MQRRKLTQVVASSNFSLGTVVDVRCGRAAEGEVSIAVRQQFSRLIWLIKVRNLQ